VENFSLHNLVYIEPIVITQNNYSYGIKTIPTSSKLRKYIVAKPYVEVLLCLTIWILSHCITIIKPIPLNLGGNLPQTIEGVKVTSM
jgi:hypothetical protein